jgi:hypothetical protein
MNINIPYQLLLWIAVIPGFRGLAGVDPQKKCFHRKKYANLFLDKNIQNCFVRPHTQVWGI